MIAITITLIICVTIIAVVTVINKGVTDRQRARIRGISVAQRDSAGNRLLDMFLGKKEDTDGFNDGFNDV